MAQYEFDDDKAEVMWNFGNKLSIISLILGTGAIFGVIASILRIIDSEEKTPHVIKMFEFIFLLGIAVIIYFPSDNFKNISTSEGRDIDELMRGFKEFNMAFLAIAGIILVVGLLNFAMLLLKL
ncbi:MAG: hypothetical protein INQ03_13825 [Candidatus Heimdallarchaeota archaeon]|nr:hypothetical protein [Candidatus Heimdallarchaeota archaeon]